MGSIIILSSDNVGAILFVPAVLVVIILNVLFYYGREQKADRLMQEWAAQERLTDFILEECGWLEKPFFFGGKGALIRKFSARLPDGSQCSGWLSYKWPWGVNVRYRPQARAELGPQGFPVIFRGKKSG